MLSIVASDPSPLVQTTVYMAGILTGYMLLMQPEEWERARETVRAFWERNRGA
jgi:hypothetical protein